VRLFVPLGPYLLSALIFSSGCYTSPESTPDKAVSRLILLLQDSSADVRRTAALSLGKIGAVQAIHPLVARLHDPDPRVRLYCAWALGNLGEQLSAAAIPDLIMLMSDADSDVASAAAQSIGKSGAAVAVPPLLFALRSDNPVTRLAAVEALAWLEARAAYPALVDSLRDTHASIRQASVAALGELGDARAVPFIEARLRHDPDVGVRAEAAYRLGKLGNEGSLAALRSAVEERSGDDRVRRWAKWAIEQLSVPGAPESTTAPAP